MNKKKTINNPPTNIEKAVERAVNTKSRLDLLFVKEFLSQLAKFLNNCNPCWLAEINGQPIKIKAVYSKKRTQHVARIKTRVTIGDLGFTISPLDLIEKEFNDFFTASAFYITPGNFYVGLENAYKNIIERIENGEAISGLSTKKKIFGKTELILDLK